MTELSPEAEQHEAETRRRMLAAEAAALLLLRRTVNGQIAAGLLADIRGLGEIRTALTLAVYRSRLTARRVGRERLSIRLGQALDPSVSESSDLLRAQRAARGWERTAFENTVKLGSAEAAIGKSSWKLDLIAASEVPQAFNDERDRLAREYERRTGVRLYKMFDAAGDRRTCPRCESLNGTVVRVDEVFPEGDPPIHGRCRCGLSIFREDELGDWLD